MKGPGLKPPQAGRFLREVIGPPDCPILHRWTLAVLARGRVKVLLHHFLPNADDRDLHDHPRPFLTFVFKGGYEDITPCDRCGGTGDEYTVPGEMPPCLRCLGDGLKRGDYVKAGSIRYRPAEHAHRTKVFPSGSWSLVIMGPLQRDWGFWRQGKWWQWRKYERHFGFGMRCDDE